VFVFFGIVAVTGTEWVLTGSFGLVTYLASMAIGGLAAAALAVNNHRDMEHDRLVGRRTFAVVFGAAGSRRLYRGLLLGPFLIVAVMAAYAKSPTLLLPILLVPTALRLLRDFVGCAPGLAFNNILFQTFRLEIWFAVLLSIGALLVGMPH
jgi:1,4-dihydroxy-2-naphthoate octaprenyltransferase